MKTIYSFSLLCSLVFAASCVDKVDTNINHGVSLAPLEAMADFEVPVMAGFTTTVTLDGRPLAVTRRPTTIRVPAHAAKGVKELEVTYSNEDIFGEFASVSWWNYLAFEDTPNGDYDFNDVVLHCAVKSDVPWNYDGSQLCKHTIFVQPVALGSGVTTGIGFGFLYRNDAGVLQEKILSADIRRDLYYDDVSFPINTSKDKATKKVDNCIRKKFEIDTHADIFPVVWFIQNGENRMYAATTNFGADRSFNMINSEGMPYGIALTQKWCYPLEKVSIRDAYPYFDKWLRAGNERVLLQDRVGANVYLNAVIKDGENGSLWDYPGGYVNE